MRRAYQTLIKNANKPKRKFISPFFSPLYNPPDLFEKCDPPH